MSIQRWSHEHPTECIPVRYDNGDWVRHEDHIAAVEEAVAAERVQARSEGLVDALEAVLSVAQSVDEIGGYSFDEALGMAVAAIYSRQGA